MNSFWAGFKNKKNLFFVFLAIFSLVNVFLANDDNIAFATSKKYTYSNTDCKNLELEFDKPGFGTRPGVGCVLYIPSRELAKTKDIAATVINSNDALSGVDVYTTNDSGKEPSVCLDGYKKGRANFLSIKDVPACIKDKNHKGAYGLPSGVKEDDIYDQKSCIEDGGGWYDVNTDHIAGRICNFKKKAGGISIEQDFVQAVIKSERPDEFFKGQSNKCPKGYITLSKIESGKQVEFCKKSSTGSNTDCTKEDKKDTKECKDAANDSSSSGDGSNSDVSEGKSSCKIDGVGWIVCPGANFLAQVAMESYKFIADNLLQVRSNELFTNTSQDKSSGKSLMEVWGNFRDIANVLFVILFTIVIISQITSLGISNYGIKKMLPRLLIFAILINVSYYISVIAVDISNIIGRSIYNTIIGSVEWSGASTSGAHSLGQIVAGGLALGTGAVFFGGTMFLALMSAMIGMVVMIITLMIRQAAVIILVVLSPIAFASAILPNTEGIFNKWKSIFKSMLVIYPMASIVVSLTVLASNTLAATASGPFSFLIEGLYLTLPFVGMAGVVALIRGALAALDKLTNANITGRLSSLAGGANKFMGNTSVAKHATNWSRGNVDALTGRDKDPKTGFGQKLGRLGRGTRIASISGRLRDSRLRADSNAQTIEENQKWDDEDRKIAMLEQMETNGTITDSQLRSLNGLRAIKQKREDDQITAQARANAIKWKMAPVKDILDNSGNIITPSTETLAKTSLANAIASRDSDRIKMAVESAKMVYGQNKTNNMISSYIENNGISQESAHALSNNFYKDFKDSSPSLSSTIEYAKSNSKGIETETVRTMDPATGKMVDKIQANQSQIDQAIDGAFDNIKMAVVNNMDAEEVKKWNAALYKMPTSERKMHARMSREAERNDAGDVIQRAELSNLYRIHK